MWIPTKIIPLIHNIVITHPTSILFQKVDPHTQRVPRSQRGGEIIEPLVSSQWFIKTEGMGAKALKAVEDGDIKIVPQRFDKIWYNWLSDIRDW